MFPKLVLSPIYDRDGWRTARLPREKEPIQFRRGGFPALPQESEWSSSQPKRLSQHRTLPYLIYFGASYLY
ncbi:hypothetical protein GCM10011389_27510 [Pontibacillus salipaludis]|uniref:Uncharacterized protein n=1 Tax=Pontibacillus salipaludis TaxID=1697394 RepID=A0ABQ1Q7V6_9BACI|nr:hypothetical protein GCM10011389_27510 [Pontibacillus salipaludis]